MTNDGTALFTGGSAPTALGHQFTLAIVGAFDALAQALHHRPRHFETRY